MTTRIEGVMGRTHSVTPTMQKKIEILLSRGKTIREISDKLGLSYGGVYYWAKPEWKERHKVEALANYYQKKAECLMKERKARRDKKRNILIHKAIPIPEVASEEVNQMGKNKKNKNKNKDKDKPKIKEKGKSKKPC